MKPVKRTRKVIVVTSMMLSFISFWRAAAIVLNDLGSSAYYVGGIAEQAVSRVAPWFIFGVMLFSYAVRAVYALNTIGRVKKRAGNFGCARPNGVSITAFVFLCYGGVML